MHGFGKAVKKTNTLNILQYVYKRLDQHFFFFLKILKQSPILGTNKSVELSYLCVELTSALSFGCGAGDHKISPTAAILGQRSIAQHSFSIASA